jgi:uncharacterized BrkB/YihY/UPF0761 family membrane protein
MERPRRLLQAVDEFQQRHRWLAFPMAVAKKYGEDQAGQKAALLAYYGFFSLFPLLLVAVTVIGFVLHGDSDLGQRIVDSAVAQFPVVGDEISGTVSHSRLRGLAWLVILGGGLLLASVVSGFAAVVGAGWSAVAAIPVNTLLFLVGFRVLTVRNVSLRTLLPGAVLAALAWAVLQWLGGWYVDRQLSRASATYGAFALVIGLLSWLYLASTVTLLAAEVNVVRSRRLWPRSLAPPPLGRPDERALESLAKQEERLPDQRVEVSFEGDAEPPAQRR